MRLNEFFFYFYDEDFNADDTIRLYDTFIFIQLLRSAVRRDSTCEVSELSRVGPYLSAAVYYLRVIYLCLIS